MQDDYISHYGVKRRSGRYPWGSGDNPYQGDDDVVRKAKKNVSRNKLSEATSHYVKRLKSLIKDKELSSFEKLVAIQRAELEMANIAVEDTFLKDLGEKSLKVYDRIYGKPKKKNE